MIISQRPWARGAGMSHPNWTGLFANLLASSFMELQSGGEGDSGLVA